MVRGGLPSGSFSGSRVVFRLALMTAIVSLLPIIFGAFVTTLGAGMAFIDWPTSDGRPLVLYPWFDSTGDKFVEHGHRLAGVIVGVMALLLFGLSWLEGVSRLTRLCCSLVLVGVIFQGVLGGLRVLLDKQFIALCHSIFGCFVFCGLWLVVLVANRPPVFGRELFVAACTEWFVFSVPMLCVAQFVAGAFVRHFGAFVYLHLIGACLVALSGIVVAYDALHVPVLGLRFARGCFVGAVVCQLILGAGVWFVKYGIAAAGVVGGQYPDLSVIVRSGHTVVGMCVVAASVIWAVDYVVSRVPAGSESVKA